MSCPYIVEKLDKVPDLEVRHSQVNELFLSLQFEVVGCKFNGWLLSIQISLESVMSPS